MLPPREKRENHDNGSHLTVTNFIPQVVETRMPQLDILAFKTSVLVILLSVTPANGEGQLTADGS